MRSTGCERGLLNFWRALQYHDTSRDLKVPHDFAAPRSPSTFLFPQQTEQAEHQLWPALLHGQKLRLMQTAISKQPGKHALHSTQANQDDDGGGCEEDESAGVRPLWQPAALDHCFLDITGMGLFVCRS